MKNIFFLFMVAILTIVASCNKENPEPEPGPQLSCGEPRAECLDCDWNIFRCKVNGEDWCANCEEGALFGCDQVDCLFNPDDNWLAITPASTDGLIFQIYNFGKITTTDTSIISYTNDLLFNQRLDGNCRFYELDTLSNSYIYIHDLNKVSNLIEGTFEFTTLNKCQDIIRVTDGYFKLTYRQ